MLDKKLIVIRGGGDIASGIASKLYNAGFKVLIAEIKKPTVIRRKVSFADAVYEKEVFIEGISGKLANDISDALKMIEDKIIPIIIDPCMTYFRQDRPYILVDSIIAKKNIGTSLEMATIVIGVGPGFTAGVDVNAVVESKRGHYLGKVLLQGTAEPNTGIPGNIEGFTEERVIWAQNEGEIKIIKDIGSIVKSGDTIALIDKTEVKSKINGIVRGMIRDGYYVNRGMKIADIDPRKKTSYCYSISDKARAIGGGVLEAILYFINKNNL